VSQKYLSIPKQQFWHELPFLREHDMKIGYARVSTNEQNLDLQIKALKEAGCEEIYTDQVSGGQKFRKGLDDMMLFARPGDQIVVWKLDRIGRSMTNLIELINDMKGRNVEFGSLQEGIDTSTSAGKFFFHILASLAEFERDMIRERTIAGIAAAKDAGRVGGRPKAVDDRQRDMIWMMYNDGKFSGADIQDAANISKATYYRVLAELKVANGVEGFKGRGRIDRG